MLNKVEIIERIIVKLSMQYDNAVAATQQAHDTATHEENIAENKYDTLGLEAGYLAFGQSQRVAECASDLDAWNAMNVISLSHTDPIRVGAFVILLDEQDTSLNLFLGPASGGLKIDSSDGEIIVVTPGAPLGQALIGKSVDDEIEVQIAKKTNQYTIEHVV